MVVRTCACQDTEVKCFEEARPAAEVQCCVARLHSEPVFVNVHGGAHTYMPRHRGAVF